MQRYLDATNDVAFKKLFSDKVKLINLLNSILRLEAGSRITELDYIPTEQMPLFIEGKRSIFDLKVKDASGHWYIIEMQRKMKKDYLNRAQYYGCYSYVKQLKAGMFHKDLLPIVVVSIIGERCFPDDVPYISYHHLKESSTKKQYLFSMTYVFVELGKFNDEITGDAEQWLHLLKYAPAEQEPPKEINNAAVLAAYDDLEQYRWSPDEHDAYVRSRLAMEAEEIEYEEKYEKGLTEGLEKGKAERDIEIAKNLLEQGINIETIAKATGLPQEEIEKLKK